MAARQEALANIKRDVEQLIGRRVRVRANRGRRKIVEREGTIESVYPSHFLVRLEEDQHARRVSYQYADVLTEIVELIVCEPDAVPEVEAPAS